MQWATLRVTIASATLLLAAGCGGGGGGSTPAPPVGAPALASAMPSAPSVPGPTLSATPTPIATALATATPSGPPPSPLPAGLTLPSGFSGTLIGRVSGARELVVTPNGDLLVGTLGTTIAIIPGAQRGGGIGQPQTFATINDAPVAGLTFAGGTLYAAGQFGIYQVGYSTGATVAGAVTKIASVRPAGASDHSTTSLAVANGTLYAAVGSSCNACDPEKDATRATVAAVDPGSGALTTRAIRIRNAIALATSSSGALWAGVAGQDSLPAGHPYEIFDAVTLQPNPANYGWPECYDNRLVSPAYPGYDCSQIVLPRVAFPAYGTPIGATFYTPQSGAAYAFPAQYRGGAFVTMHGSWHQSNGVYITPPSVAFVPFSGADTPVTAVDWSNPAAQWTQFMGGFQRPDGVTRIGRPTGIAVGTDGSLFVADDQTGNIYRIRPGP